MGETALCMLSTLEWSERRVTSLHPELFITGLQLSASLTLVAEKTYHISHIISNIHEKAVLLNWTDGGLCNVR